MSIISSSKIKTRIGSRTNTQENWEAENPVLLSGEVIYVIVPNGDTRMKVGNGTSNYSTLPFVDDKFPKVSTEDEGKFLVVENGQWVAKTIPLSVIYTGEAAPTNDIGNDGDLYLQIDSQ